MSLKKPSIDEGVSQQDVSREKAPEFKKWFER
jgi:hypothetical protein